MFAIQRSEKILELLEKKGIVHVNNLVDLFQVSDVTIRKDLNKLQEQGLITKTHGGAVLNKKHNTLVTPPKNSSSPTSITLKKEKLAAAAYPYIQKGDTIFLGSGYTCAALARHIKRSDDISVITNNLEAALILKEKCRTLILMGGEVIVYDNYTFTTNPQMSEYLKTFNINKTITSCSAIDKNFGISVSTEVNHKIITSVLEVAYNWYLLVDESKFNQVSPYKVADVSSVDMILSDIKSDEYSTFKNIITI
ncbi:DeoR/GlpR transcriptional regulator [Vallitalea pronyensis]|uniref:DeoR/GlpR transcriptional regulator n=1 Tax=Vallitalea pronyensis TaxID=1348613 RepID=A0A8J8MG37_9FIRM|nr:DeoR/GlpR family DNA-binding transcription regulator [Vallitalea pronyensis]QUI21152.1 DeoR/GlpR transcriptional regulator [Vallitalea pronyensis]